MDTALLAHWEVRADIAEQRPLGAREVMPVDGHTLNDCLTGPQDMLVIGVGGDTRLGSHDMGSQLPVDGPTELIHGDPSPSFSIELAWSTPAVPRRLRSSKDIPRKEHVDDEKGSRFVGENRDFYKGPRRIRPTSARSRSRRRR